MEQRPGQLSSSSQQPPMQPPHEFLNSSNANSHNVPPSLCCPSYTASSASQDTPSSDWQEFTDTDGRRYYYNKRTKQSSWEKPLELMTPMERADASTLWKEFTTAEGKKYYYNKDTKQSKWTIPDELKLACELAEKEASRGTQSRATLTTSTYDRPSASVSSANDISLSTTTKMSKKDAGCLATTSVGSKKKKVAGSSGQGNVMGLEYEFPDDFDFTYFDKPEDYKPPKAKATRASSAMKHESHPWLQFRDADKNEKILCLNRLAEIQDFPVATPKRIDWHLLGRLGVKDDILTMIQSMGMNQQLEYENIDMWRRIFRLEEPAYREWCLEFYSTLEVETLERANEITQKQTIHFRLGGKKRHCTVMGFAYLTGMLEKEEMRRGWVYEFMLKGAFNVPEFSDETTIHQYWYDISGQGAHSSHSSKLSQIRSKRLRLLHKMITNSFMHRGDNHNKVYSEDLWLLRYFSESSPGEHVLAPYLLARHMSRYKEKRLLCGHFISVIAKRLGLEHRPENTKNLGNPVRVGLIGELDLVKAGMLSADRNRLLEDDEAPAPAARAKRRKVETAEPEDEEEEEAQPQMGPSPYDFTALRGDLQRLANQQAFMIEQQRYFSSQQSRMDYTLGFYRPMWHNQMEQMYQSRPNMEDRQMPEFTPPELYTPRQFQSDYPYPPHTSGGASGSQPHASSSFHAGGASGTGAAYDPMAYDPYGAELFGV